MIDQTKVLLRQILSRIDDIETTIGCHNAEDRIDDLQATMEMRFDRIEALLAKLGATIE